MLNPQMEMGARVCKRIKTLCYPNEPWPKVVMKTSVILTGLKKIGRVFYPDDDIVQILRYIADYTDEALMDAINLIPDLKDEINGTGRQMEKTQQKVEK